LLAGLAQGTQRRLTRTGEIADRLMGLIRHPDRCQFTVRPIHNARFHGSALSDHVQDSRRDGDNREQDVGEVPDLVPDFL
jgi:hypothetical protein